MIRPEAWRFRSALLRLAAWSSMEHGGQGKIGLGFLTDCGVALCAVHKNKHTLRSLATAPLEASTLA